MHHWGDMTVGTAVFPTLRGAARLALVLRLHAGTLWPTPSPLPLPAGQVYANSRGVDMSLDMHRGGERLSV